jgi:hypothetical protein
MAGKSAGFEFGLKTFLMPSDDTNLMLRVTQAGHTVGLLPVCIICPVRSQFCQLPF